ncbi:PD-(D/E)XK nuclease family protein [Leeuwenhoekiella nanhaiensis]|uniref:PD-(D/E)XK nuclease superfamily protein n=1 Tax=Leeuwenhoekiella nanhaiensis TaxID=1655491 RepID=A0A2G1VLZ7_9FLAO|nr:PD-(D/E)XK nuclease family protein [Leeuwenhoekiella nanhaiensis]PHQ27797.1 hypothetical protein CJ305_18245 [Leeuwenhoekiella nanhaiensis]
MNFKELQEFLDTAAIPIIEPKPLTFLEIARQPHYENVLSNIYAFFFDVEQEHGFQDLFISSLLELIQESKLGKQKEALQNFSDFTIETEYSTKKGGRIDLLLHNEQQAIIIENKVYHIVNNDLDDYWQSIQKKGIQKTEMIGIILSLDTIHKISTNKLETALHFINIKHQDLMLRVLQNSGAYLLRASDKYAVYLKDFAQNIQNMSTPDMKLEELQFYKEHQDQLLQARRFLERFEDYVKKGVIKAFKELDPDDSFLNIVAGSNLIHVYSKHNPDLLFTVGYSRLWDMQYQSMNVIVELKDKAIKDCLDLTEEHFSEEEFNLVNLNSCLTKKNWCHFASETYSEVEIDFNNLSNYLAKRIEKDQLLAIFLKLDNFLTLRRS